MPRQQEAAGPQMSLMAVSGGPQPSLMSANLPLADLTAYQGDDKRWIFRLKKSDSSPFDLTGYTAALQFRVVVADDDLNQPIEPDVEVTDPTAGEITVTLSSESSMMLVQPQYLWDLEITETAASWTTTIARGTLAVTKEVTRVEGPLS